jgi:hypothetical protein
MKIKKKKKKKTEQNKQNLFYECKIIQNPSLNI